MADEKLAIDRLMREWVADRYLIRAEIIKQVAEECAKICDLISHADFTPASAAKEIRFQFRLRGE